MQDNDLFAQYSPDNEHRFDHDRQVGQVLDKLPDSHLELHRPDHADLEAEVAQGTPQIILNGDRLRLQKLTMGQQRNGTTST